MIPNWGLFSVCLYIARCRPNLFIRPTKSPLSLTTELQVTRFTFLSRPKAISLRDTCYYRPTNSLSQSWLVVATSTPSWIGAREVERQVPRFRYTVR